MYQITCDNEIIHDVRLKNRTVLSPVLNLEVGKNGTLSFILSPNNELYNNINQKKSIIKVYQVDRINNGYVSTELFRGTAYSEKTDFWKRKHVECEGELSFFNDGIVRTYSYQGDVETLFKKYVNDYNSQVNESKRFTPRRCTVTDPNNYIARANLKSAIGENVELKNTAEARFKEFEIQGNSKQKTREGYNLLDVTINSQTVKGVTFTINEDKSISCNGTAD